MIKLKNTNVIFIWILLLVVMIIKINKSDNTEAIDQRDKICLGNDLGVFKPDRSYKANAFTRQICQSLFETEQPRTRIYYV